MFGFASVMSLGVSLGRVLGIRWGTSHVPQQVACLQVRVAGAGWWRSEVGGRLVFPPPLAAVADGRSTAGRGPCGWHWSKL